MTWFARQPSRREREALLDYWDEVIAQSPATPVPPATVPDELGALVRAVHVADVTTFEHPAYEDRLLRSLLARQKEIASMNATAAIAPPLSPPGKPLSTKPHRRTDRSRTFALRPALISALVVLLILASAAGIWLAGNRHDEPHRLMAPIVATPGPDASPGVPMYRANPERTGVMPGPGIDGQPVQLWRAEFDGPLTAVPSLVNGVLYLGAGDGGIHAVDAATGETVWTFAGSSPISSTPAIHNGVVISGSEDGTLYALDAADGSEIWSFPGARALASVAIVDNTVYTGSGDGFLYALDAATGEEIWSAPLGADASRSPAVSEGVVFQGSADGVLHTFDAETGEPGWAVTLDGDGTISTTVITGGVVYQGTFEGEENYFFALDAATGEELWRLESTAGLGFYNAAADGETVYAPTHDGIIYALDATTGEVRWQAATGDGFATGPSLVGNTLYATSTGGNVYALDVATGREQWRYAIEGAANGGVIVSGGVAYLGTSFGYLYAIGGSGEPIMATPAATPGATPVATQDMPVALAWQSTGGPDPLLAPSGLTFDPDGNLWVVDTGNNRFQIFSPEGEYLETWGTAGDGDGEFDFYRTPNNPGEAVGDIAFASDGSFYVSSAGDKRIQHFSADRTFLYAWGSEGTGDGQFLDPFGIAVGPDGNVYVIDDVRNVVQVFNPEGTFLFTFGESGTEPGQLFDTGSLAIDADGNVWVADWGNNRVQQFAADGTFIMTFGEFGPDEGQLNHPEDLVVDQAGNVYVAEPDMGRVQVFTPGGGFLMAWSAADDGEGVLTAPLGIAVDADGGVYVTDIEAGTAQKFEVTLPAVAGATPVS